MEEVHDSKTLIYVADPMCSWCWGFAPVLEDIRRRHENQASFQLMLGGLRPGNTERFDESRRTYILQHWHAVHERTAQPFNFDFQMESTFTYDTEPASRATLVVRQLMPGKEWKFLKSVQMAFYEQNTDVTKAKVLEELAVVIGADAVQFRQLFHESQTKQRVWDEFDQARQLGVNGFPTLLGRQGQSISTLMHGYQDIETLIPSIDKFFEKVS